MTHLKIEQNTTGIEEVSSAVIKKLYDLVYSGTLDNTSNLLGRLHTTSTYQSYVDYLTGLYPNLYITANKYYHDFVDPEVERIIVTAFGDGIGISRLEIAAITNTFGSNSIFAGNTTITNLNDLLYFTGVTEITDKFARGATNLTSVIVPPNITSLSYGTTTVANFGAFRDCTSLSSVTLNEGLLRIMNRCFTNCTSLTTIDIPSTCTQIGRNDIYGSNTFDGCTSLTTVTGCEGLDEIGGSAFYGCTALTSVPTSTVTKFGNSCFRNCSALTTVDTSSATTIRDGAFRECSNLTSVNLSNVTTIEQTAFNHAGLNGAILLSNIDTMGQGVFAFTGLTSADFTGSTITSIPSSTFTECRSLSSVTIPSTITSTGYDVFKNCTSLNNIDLSNLTLLGQNAFYGCTSLTSANLSNCTIIGPLAFYGCSYLTSVDVSNVVNCGSSAFAGCKRLSIPELNMSNLTLLGQFAFSGCEQLETISNLGNITNIPSGAFGNCLNLRSVILPTSLITAPGGGFANSKVQKLIYPYGLTSMVDEICRGYTGRYLLYMQFPSTLTLLRLFEMYRDSGNNITCYIVIQATTPPSTGREPSNTTGIGLGWGWGNPTLARWYVPDSALNDYKTHSEWSVIENYIFPISLLETDSPTNWQLYQNNKNYGIS